MLRRSRPEEFPLSIRRYLLCGTPPPSSVRWDLVPGASVSGFFAPASPSCSLRATPGTIKPSLFPCACKAVSAQIEGKQFDPSKYAFDKYLLLMLSLGHRRPLMSGQGEAVAAARGVCFAVGFVGFPPPPPTPP